MYSIVFDLMTSNLCLAYSSNLKMEATYSLETLADFQRNKCHYVPELFIITAVRTSNPTLSKSYKNELKLFDYNKIIIIIIIIIITDLWN
jgi:hypothetical protein